ncbi:MAG: phospholipase A [Kordiimonas sp.]
MFFKRCWLALVLCFGGMSDTIAQEVALTIIEGDYTPGSTLKVAVFIGNDSSASYSVPRTLKAHLKSDAPYIFRQVQLHYDGEELTELTLQGNGFGRFTYSLTLPDDLELQYYLLGLETWPVEPAYVRVAASTHVAEVQAQRRNSGEELQEVGKPEGVEGNLINGVSTYKPIYFLFGGNPFDAKFQISLKYQLFNPQGIWAESAPWLSGFHLGYTQTAFWDLAAESKPFEDTNFMPEAFYSIEDLKLGFLPDGSKLDFQTGILHESNGKGGDDSRSLNIFYGRATYEHPISKDWFFRLTGDVWQYVGSLEDNIDIADFRGHSSLGFTVGAKRGVQFSSYRRGKFGNNKGSYLFDVTVPIKRIGKARNLNFTLHGQLFTGYGENLITYDQKETRLRFGLGIHR